MKLVTSMLGRKHLCLFSQHLDLSHLSGGWLILLDFDKRVLKLWKKSFFVYTKKKPIIKLFTSTSKKTRCWIYILVYLMQYLEFVSGAIKWPQNLAGLKLVFNKVGVQWQPHWLCVLYWALTANFTLLYTLQYETSCRLIPCWWPARPAPKQHKTTYAVFFQQGSLYISI